MVGNCNEGRVTYFLINAEIFEKTSLLPDIIAIPNWHFWLALSVWNGGSQNPDRRLNGSRNTQLVRKQDVWMMKRNIVFAYKGGGINSFTEIVEDIDERLFEYIAENIIEFEVVVDR